MKHDREEPLNLGWLADRGAREAPLDKQGFLKEEPKPDSVSTDRYNLLLNGLYEAAREAFKKTPQGEFIGLYSFMAALEKTNPEAVHQIDSGVTDAHKYGERGVYRCHDGPIETLDSASLGGINGGGCLKHGILWIGSQECPDCAKANRPPADNTTEPLFTEEEIAVVKAWCNDLDLTYRDVAVRPFKGIPCWPNSVQLQNRITEARCRAIAEHLAKMEG